MNTPPFDDVKKQALVHKASARLGWSEKELARALEANDAAALQSRLSPDAAAKLSSLMRDEAAMKALLARPELQALLRSLGGKE